MRTYRVATGHWFKKSQRKPVDPLMQKQARKVEFPIAHQFTTNTMEKKYRRLHDSL